MGQRVKRVRTTVSAPQMEQAISQAWMDLFSQNPSKEQVSMVMAQNALETGNRRSMWNYNVGNITTDGQDYNYYDDLTTDEQMSPGVWKKKNLKYRAYNSLDEGIKDYLSFLKNHYTAAWQHIVNPDPISYSKELKRGGYYSANEAPYTKDMVSLYNGFANSNIKYNEPEGNIQNIINQIMGNKSSPVNSVLQTYLQSVMASDKKLYQKYLPHHYAIIKLNGDYTDTVEFGRVLCSALQEELLAKAFIYTDGKSVEIETDICGSKTNCLMAMQQLTQNISEAFCDATKKIGNIKIDTKIIINKRSSFRPITLKTAEIEYRKFLLKLL